MERGGDDDEMDLFVQGDPMDDDEDEDDNEAQSEETTEDESDVADADE